MLQYIFIHAEASNTMDRKHSHPKPWTENHRIQNHVRKIMHKTIGRSAQPNIGSKNKIFKGVAPNPIEWGYLHPSNVLWPSHYAIGVTKGGLHPPSKPLVNYVG